MPQKKVSQKFFATFRKCMAVEEKQPYIHGGSRPKIAPCLNMLEFVTFRIVCYASRLRMNTFGEAFFSRLKWGFPASLNLPSSLGCQSRVTSHVIPQMDSLFGG